MIKKSVTSERVKGSEKVKDFIVRLAERKMCKEEEISLYEEVHPAFIEPLLSFHLTFAQLNLLEGDILIFHLFVIH